MNNPLRGMEGVAEAIGSHDHNTPEPSTIATTDTPTSTWAADALDALDQLAASGLEFTADDVRAAGVGEPPHPSYWGALFLTAQAAGAICKVGIAPARRRRSHSSIVHVWIGSEHLAGGAQ